ncbi:NADH:flavorubredoxin reductase NorW [Vibrio albus]|uniref:NADH:flavorubredoxin reductase NorW n=1 Tax=Vibrio albus TaxID=2200953 RepID=A0A2U3B6K8_9VIBR|nr:NADH:flavorubredoxin reductase NorW [Vibrio albus]PWI32428.1 NADH:flavorubredoxin reductase NorW [Vibrio albus]
MTNPLIIIGSGFAAYQLVKNIRRQNSELPVQVFTADSGDEYNKPDLSHVFTRKQTAEDLVSTPGNVFAEQQQIELFCYTRVESIDPAAHSIIADGKCYPYSRLVFATGAQSFVPLLSGNATGDIVTLNSLQEYRDAHQRIVRAERVLIMGGGLIGVELALDMLTSGKQVHIIEPGMHLLSNLIPGFLSTPLECYLRSKGMQVDCLDYVTEMNRRSASLSVQTSRGVSYDTDCVISAAGLTPRTELAKKAGLAVNRGIVVDNRLRTSVKDIYALGDCAEIEGKIMAFLQPIVLSANILAKQLLTSEGELGLPAMMVKVKTPGYPIQLGGSFESAVEWQVNHTEQGTVARAYDQNNRMTGFVVTQEQVNQAFPLLREVQTAR